MSSWTDDVAACLDLMLEPGQLFDEGRALRADRLLRRLHPRFGGSIEEKLREELAALEERQAVERIADGVYRWLGLREEADAQRSLRERVRARLAQSDAAAPARVSRRAEAPQRSERATTASAPAATPRPAPVAAPREAAPRESAPGRGAGFQEELDRRLTEAANAGKRQIHVASFDLHRAIAPYPALGHQMPLCCRVLRGALREGDVVVNQSPDGKDGPELLIRFALPR